jgi:CRISPR-associated protein Csx10
MNETPQTQTGTNGNGVLNDSFTVRLEMLSDWHIGAGFGRPGNIDSLVQRDPNGLPFVPAKTLTGIWRDALEHLVYALDERNQNGAWSRWVDFLFGNQPALPGAPPDVKPRSARLEIKPAYLPELLRVRLTGKKQKPLRDALTFIKPSVQIEDASGTSETDFLRFEEMARAGSFLEAECKFNAEGVIIDAEQRQTLSALLVTSALLVERIGGKRRRGSGKCRLRIAGCDVNEAIKWLEESSAPPHLPPTKETTDRQEKKAETSEAAIETWVPVPLRLKLKQPIAIAARTLGNVTETLDYVPGTYLLPYITKQLEDLLQDANEDCRQLFASARLQVLPATIEIDGERGLPVPAAIFRYKVGGGFDKVKYEENGKRAITVFNRFREEESTMQLKGYRSGYIEPVKNADTKPLPFYAEVPLILLTHNTVQDDSQRPTSDVGGVYSREAIHPQATLRTELRLSRALYEKLKEKEPRWWARLAGECRIGVSSKDDYGAAEVEVLFDEKQKALTSSNASVTQCGDTQASDKQDAARRSTHSELIVWLQSDVLLRGSALRPTTDSKDLRKELQKRINAELKSDQNATTAPSVTLEAVTSEKHLTSLIHTRRIESWQKSWGRPRPSLVALAAGSCVVFKINPAVDSAKLQAAMQAIEASGMGERRGEGYGQVSFNSSLLIGELKNWNAITERKEAETQESNLPALVPIEQYQHIYEFAQLIEETAWRTALRRAVLRVAADADKRYEILGLVRKGDAKSIKEDSPPMSQLGGLRAVLNRLQNKADRKHFTQWHGHLIKTQNRADKWSARKRREDAGALEKVNRLVTQDDAVWQALSLKQEEMPVLTADAEKRLKEKLWGEAVRSLVDACIRAHKRATENKEQLQTGTANSAGTAA